MPNELQQRISALRTAERRFEPDAAWIRTTRVSLLKEVSRSLPTEPVRAHRQVSQFFRHFVPPQISQMLRGPVIAMAAVMVTALGGSVASVSAAEQSLPGDFLYSLKLATEQARLAFTATKEDKLKLKIEFTSRRGDELKTVAESDAPEKPGRVVQAAEILKRDLDTMKQQLDDVKSDSSSKNVVEVAKLVDQKTGELVQQLQDTKSDLPAETKEKITEAQVAAADTGVKALEVLVEKHQESSDALGASEVVQAIQDHTKVLANVTGDPALVSSTTAIISTTTTTALPVAMEQLKAATQNAFATQKTQEQLMASSSTTDGTTAASSSTSATMSATSTSGTPVGTTSSTSSTASSSTSSSVQKTTPP
ncbi:MAG: DUF5667 domain-containing protein [Patescibacteria group bacterium]